MPLGINLGTEAYVNFDTVGTVNTQVIGLSYGTVSTVGTLPNTPGGTLGVVQSVSAGTITKVEGGTIGNLVSGTINSATAVLNSGTINVSTAVITTLPNLPQGSINVTAGTITEGTLRNLISGTINSATAVLNSGTINVATATVTSGSIVVTASTITVLPNLPQGSINVTAGTIGGKAASGAAAIANPVLIGGTDSGGTVYSPLVTTAGALGSLVGVSVVSNLTNGSIVVTAGTVAAHAITAATITEGTLRNLISGTINAATAVLNSGTINVGTFVMPSGTLNVATISTLPNLPQGSINVTAGTVSAGTVNVATITAGTINTATITGGTVHTTGTVQELYGAAAALTITLASLANSGSVGRISNYVNNSSNLYQSALVYCKFTVGSTASTANQPFYVYLARSDNAGTINDDGNGTVDASGTFINTPLLGVVNCANAGTNQSYFGVFDTSFLGPLGPAWGIGVVNNSGGSLHPTAGSQAINYIPRNQQIV